MCLRVLRLLFSFFSVLLFCFNRVKLITVIKKAIQLIHSNCDIQFGYEIDVLFMLIKARVCLQWFEFIHALNRISYTRFFRCALDDFGFRIICNLISLKWSCFYLIWNSCKRNMRNQNSRVHLTLYTCFTSSKISFITWKKLLLFSPCKNA